MTEAEWLSCDDPKAMLDFLKARASDRKLRLFAVACCRRIWSRLSDHHSRAAVDLAERYAEGLAGIEELSAAADAAWTPTLTALNSEYYAAMAAYYAVNDPASADADDVADAVVRSSFLDPSDPEVEDLAQTGLLRDIFGNPFSPVSLDPSWLIPAVLPLAKAIYDERAFERMPELADNLEQAGCANADILDHCRGPGPHVRGCWVVDLLLGQR